MVDFDLINIDILKKNYSKNIIFGTGFYGKLAYSAFKQKGVNIDCFVDENPTQHGKLLHEKTIISLEDLIEKEKDLNIFLCTGYVINSLSERLKKLGFYSLYYCTSFFDDVNFDKEKLSFHGVNNYLDVKTINRKIEIYKSGCKDVNKSELNIKYIDIMITEKCSLKCKDCSNLMQYYQKPINSDLDVLKNSVDKVMESVDRLFEFRVLGGEPFMNKDIGKIVNHLKKYKKVSQIVIYTTGTILPKGENLNELKDPRILLDITNYAHLSRNHDKLIELCKKENIPFLTTVPKWTDSGRINYQKKTEEKLKFMFKNCCTNDYLTLLNGKLYRCPFSANTMNLKAIPIKDNEFIDLEKNLSKQDLKNEMINLYHKPEYLTACNFCNGRDFTTPRIETAIQAKEPILYEQVTDLN